MIIIIIYDCFCHIFLLYIMIVQSLNMDKYLNVYMFLHKFVHLIYLLMQYFLIIFLKKKSESYIFIYQIYLYQNFQLMDHPIDHHQIEMLMLLTFFFHFENFLFDSTVHPNKYED